MSKIPNIIHQNNIWSNYLNIIWILNYLLHTVWDNAWGGGWGDQGSGGEGAHGGLGTYDSWDGDTTGKWHRRRGVKQGLVMSVRVNYVLPATMFSWILNLLQHNAVGFNPFLQFTLRNSHPLFYNISKSKNLKKSENLKI